MKRIMQAALVFICFNFIFVSFADYFPFNTVELWTFSYQSTSTVVVPSAPTTHDSGTVTWQIVDNSVNAGVLAIKIKQTHNLIHRTYTGYTGLDTTGSNTVNYPAYDSTFSPARITIDTVILWQSTIDSLNNSLYFENATCPFAVHNDTISENDSLTISDTTITFGLYQFTCIKTSPPKTSSCSCYKGYSWSFILAEGVGPMETTIDVCPSFAGSTFSETRNLISYTLTVPIKTGCANAVVNKGITFRQLPGKTIFSLPVSCKSTQTVDFAIYTMHGRQILRRPDVSNNIEWNTGTSPEGVYIIRVKIDDKDLSQKIMLRK